MNNSGAALSKDEIEIRLNLPFENESKLVVTPLIDLDNQIHNSAIDLRLGNDFILFKRSRLSGIDPLVNATKENLRLPPYEYQERYYVEIGSSIVLHPHQLILGSSLEVIGIPGDIVAQVTSRSSWGRLGLVVATAIMIHPLYKGIITFELANYSDTPVFLYPGTRISQLILFKTSMHKEPNKSAYMDSLYPDYSRIFEDYEWEIISKLNTTKSRGKFGSEK